MSPSQRTDPSHPAHRRWGPAESQRVPEPLFCPNKLTQALGCEAPACGGASPAVDAAHPARPSLGPAPGLAEGGGAPSAGPREERRGPHLLLRQERRDRTSLSGLKSARRAVRCLAVISERLAGAHTSRSFSASVTGEFVVIHRVFTDGADAHQRALTCRRTLS